MSTHEFTAADCSWPQIQFDSPESAFKFAAVLERELEKPDITDERKQEIDDQLDELFALLFDTSSL